MVDISKFKSMSSKNSLQFLTDELNKISVSSEKKFGDDRFWQPTVDKSGNGYAVIRFLPTSDVEENPIVKLFEHGFQGPTGLWYIEKSLTTIGKTDPLTEYNNKLWNSNSDDKSPERTQVRKQKRKLHYISNILVIEDPGNPDNNGKVFLYKFGKKIYDKINEAHNPQFADEESLNPFDLWNGASFKLKIRKVEGYRNYDKSEFSSTREPVAKTDKEIGNIIEKTYSLKEFNDPSTFKTYDELKERLNKVLDLNGTVISRAEKQVLEETPSPSFKSSRASKESEEDVPFSTDEDDDDSLEFFKKLANK